MNAWREVIWERIGGVKQKRKIRRSVAAGCMAVLLCVLSINGAFLSAFALEEPAAETQTEGEDMGYTNLTEAETTHDEAENDQKLQEMTEHSSDFPDTGGFGEDSAEADMDAEGTVGGKDAADQRSLTGSGAHPMFADSGADQVGQPIRNMQSGNVGEIISETSLEGEPRSESFPDIETEQLNEEIESSFAANEREMVSEETFGEEQQPADGETAGLQDIAKEGTSELEEAETEAPEAEEKSYRVYFEENEAAVLVPEKDEASYYPGEEVRFHVEAESDTILRIEAFACEIAPEYSPSEKEASSQGDDQGIQGEEDESTSQNEIDTGEGEDAGETEIRVTDELQELHYEEDGETVWFFMPEAEVAVLLDVEEKLAEEAVSDEEEDEDPVPDKFKLICSKYPDFPKAPSSMQGSLGYAMTSRKKVVFYESDGTKTTRTAYCLQPAANTPGSGDVYEKEQAVELEDKTSKDRNLTKALYYLYGGPAWGKKIEYEDGLGSVNLKELLNNGGKDCTSNDHYYCMTHYILSYLYLGSGGKWNYMYTSEPVANVLNSHGVNTVKQAAEEIARLPLPSTELSSASVTADYQSGKGISISKTIQYKTLGENYGTLQLPKGITLVNETTGVRSTGTAVLEGGDKFHLEAPSSLSGLEQYLISTTYAVDFTAMKLVRGGNHQDVGFSYYSGDKTLSFDVEWPAQGILKLQKTDSQTKKSEPYNDRYSLANAVYGVYLDSACTQKMTQMTTGAEGTASVELPLGTYYVKEITPPPGYQKNEKVYKADLVSAGSVISVQAEDTPVLKKIRIQKMDKETGKYEPQNASVSFRGAEYTVYSDQECTNAVEVLQTDEQGTAVSKELRMADYFVKETKAPKGYIADAKVHRISMKRGETALIYDITSEEQIIRGSLALMKYLDDAMEESVLQDLYEAGTLENIRFRLVHEDESVAPVSIVTDRYGYAATARNGLVFGTWYLTEDPQTTPQGYQGVRDVKIEILEENAEQIYVVTNKPYEAYICIRKIDEDSGNAVGLNHALFQILDSEGKPMQMPTFEGYTDVFETNDSGEIHLTRALKGGKYSLVEVKSPEGYRLAAPISFEIKENAVFQEPLIIDCSDAPEKGTVSITKIDEATGEHCGPGFVFQVIVKEDIPDGSGQIRVETIDGEEMELTAGTVADTITTNEDGIALSRELYLGSYIIKEILPGEYYANNETVYDAELRPGEDGAKEPIVADLQINNEKTILEIIKQDSALGTEMPGVKFGIWEKQTPGGGDLNYREGETDQEGKLRFENLKHNTVYCLQEAETLPGYVLDDTIYEISVDENGWIDGLPLKILTLSNVANTVDISKKSITDIEELPGARLTVSNVDGTVIEEWVSTDKPHRITGLVPGSYTLTEVTAPKGYDVAESIIFTLRDSFEVQTVTMYDKPLEEETEQEETETEKEIEPKKPKKQEIQKQPVVETEVQSPKTGDQTPIAGLFFLAGCGLFTSIVNIFRRKDRKR